MWRPRGEFQESLAVAVGTSLLAIVLVLAVSPRALRGVLPAGEASFAERAIRAELASLARAQERYFAAHGRYADDLTRIPWRSGYNLSVRVREADSSGFRATASSGGTDPADCAVTVTRRDADSGVMPPPRVTCNAETSR